MNSGHRCGWKTVYFRQIVMKTSGKKGGRRQGMTKEAEKKAILAKSYYKQGDIAVDKFALEIRVSKMTFYKYLRYRKVPI